MTALLYLIPIALGLGLLGVCAFFWSLNTGQYEDPDGAARRILTDDDLDGRSLEGGELHGTPPARRNGKARSY